MAVTLVDNLKKNVFELDEITKGKEKLAHDVNKAAQAFLKRSFVLSKEELEHIVNSLNSKSSWLSRILGLSDEKGQQPNAKAEHENMASNNGKSSLRQKMQEVSNMPRLSAYDEIDHDRS